MFLNIKIHRSAVYWLKPLNHYLKVVTSVCLSGCLFVCPIITQEPLDWLASNFDWRTRETHGNVLSLVKKVLRWIGWLLKRKLSYQAKLGFQASIAIIQFSFSRPGVLNRIVLKCVKGTCSNYPCIFTTSRFLIFPNSKYKFYDQSLHHQAAKT